MTSHPITGIILFAHGSRDPQWRLPVEAIATRIRSNSADTPVACAYLELCAPDMPTAASELVAQGVTKLRIFPVFFGVGKHAREDLPVLVDDLRRAHPTLQVVLLPTAGEDERLTALMADMAVG